MANGGRMALLAASLITFLAAIPISANGDYFDNWDTSDVDTSGGDYGYEETETEVNDFYDDCTTCDDDCDCWCGFWIVGTEATFLNPDFAGAGVSSTIVDPIAVASETIAGQAGLNNLYAGPRVWLGYQGDVWGIVGRYWKLAGSEIAYDPFLDFGQAPLSNGILSENRFDAYTVDLEAVRSWYFYDTKMQFAFGARHAALDQDSIIVVSETVNASVLTGAAASFREFHGTGLTLAWGGFRPLCWTDNLNVFWNLRSSILWGSIRNAAEAQAQVSGPVLSSAFAGDLSDIEDDLFIGEAQLGVQWDHELQHLPAIAFVRAAAEYQYWDATGGSATAIADVAVADAQVTTRAIAESLQMDLIGFTVGTGLMW